MLVFLLMVAYGGGGSSTNLMSELNDSSVLWTEVICIQAQTKICHRTLILLLHYLAKTNRSVHYYRTPWLLLQSTFNKQSKIDNIWQKYLADYAVINTNNILVVVDQLMFKACAFHYYGKKLTGVPLIMPHRVDDV